MIQLNRLYGLTKHFLTVLKTANMKKVNLYLINLKYLIQTSKIHVSVSGTLGADFRIIIKPAYNTKRFTVTVLNQSGKAFLPNSYDRYKARVTYTVVNTGGYPVQVSTEGMTNTQVVSGADYSNADGNNNVFTIQSDGRLTIAGDIIGTNFFNTNYGLNVTAANGDAKVQVSATAVVDGKAVDPESQSVRVDTKTIEERITGNSMHFLY